MTNPADQRFQQALLATAPNLRAFAFSLCGNPHTTNDLVQETLLKAWTHRAKFEEGTNLKAWLFTILRNVFFSEFRRGRREVQDIDGNCAAALVQQPEQLSHMDMVDFRTALASLPDDQREALILVGAEGFSYEEAATIAGCAIGTVKSRVNRARVRLAGLLKVAGVSDFGPDLTLPAMQSRRR